MEKQNYSRKRRIKTMVKVKNMKIKKINLIFHKGGNN